MLHSWDLLYNLGQPNLIVEYLDWKWHLGNTQITFRIKSIATKTTANKTVISYNDRERTPPLGNRYFLVIWRRTLYNYVQKQLTVSKLQYPLVLEPSLSLSVWNCCNPRHKDFPKVLRNQELFTMHYSHHQHTLDPAVFAADTISPSNVK